MGMSGPGGTPGYIMKQVRKKNPSLEGFKVTHTGPRPLPTKQIASNSTKRAVGRAMPRQSKPSTKIRIPLKGKN